MTKGALKGVIIVGTDTGVGKTTVAAGLLQMLRDNPNVRYWKAVQTGAIVADDFHEAQQISGMAKEHFLEPAYRFPEPLTPHVAARKWGKKIEVSKLVSVVDQEVAAGKILIIEGAGGPYVPYNDTEYQIDFMKRIQFPVILVGQDRVGTVGQGMLVVRALREANIEVLGMILTRKRGTFGNAETISEFGKVQILAELPDSENKSLIAGEVAQNNKLRSIFQVAAVP